MVSCGFILSPAFGRAVGWRLQDLALQFDRGHFSLAVRIYKISVVSDVLPLLWLLDTLLFDFVHSNTIFVCHFVYSVFQATFLYYGCVNAKPSKVPVPTFFGDHLPRGDRSILTDCLKASSETRCFIWGLF